MLLFFFVPLAFQFCVCRQVGSIGRCFPDTCSLALEIQSVASVNFLGKCEVRAAGSIRNLILVLWSWIAEIRSMFFNTMSCFGFLRFGFCL